MKPVGNAKITYQQKLEKRNRAFRFLTREGMEKTKERPLFVFLGRTESYIGKKINGNETNLN
jgi:hypothetical protein